MIGIGKLLILAGVFMIFAGALIVCGGKIPWLGRLPGDLLIRKENVTLYVPLTTSLILSLIVSLLLLAFHKRSP